MDETTPADEQPRAPRKPAATRRRERTQEILVATRALFDERGVGDAQIEDIARAVGINRAIVYRHFSGKEELFALTLVGYLEELRGVLTSQDDPDTSPTERLTSIVRSFAEYGIEYPAFVDCAQSLMRRTGSELLDEVSEDAALRLGRSMAGCLGLLTQVLDAGNTTGEFRIDSPPTLANLLYATALGTLQLARVGLLVHEASPGNPEINLIDHDQAKDYLVQSAVALATYTVA